MPISDLTGKKFFRLTALYPTDKRAGHSVVWHCKCDCGNEVEAYGQALTHGRTVSCGCYKSELELKHIAIVHKKQREESAMYETALKVVKVGKNPPKNNKTGCLGVYKHQSGKYISEIRFQKKRYYLGYFEKLEDAVEARRIAEEKLYGDFQLWYNERKLNNSKEKQNEKIFSRQTVKKATKEIKGF